MDDKKYLSNIKSQMEIEKNWANNFPKRYLQK